MLRYYFINKQWMLSPGARRSYRVASSLSLALFFFIFFVAVAVQLVTIPEALLPVLKLLLFVGVLGAATTMVAMEYFLFSFDNSSDMKKVFWFCVMLFPLLGAPLYCFVVYSHSDVVKSSGAQRLEGASE